MHGFLATLTAALCGLCVGVLPIMLFVLIRMNAEAGKQADWVSREQVHKGGGTDDKPEPIRSKNGIQAD